PLERTEVQRIAGKKVAVCPVLRAGLGMLDGVLSLVSSARVGFIGLYRDEETLQPVEYYVKLPELGDGERDAIVLDPMLATGRSSAAAVAAVKNAWGAVAACGSVILLTPAVGGMARMLGVVDEPGARRLNRRAVPRLGGLALFFGIFIPALAFLPLGRETKGLLLGAAVATLVGAVDDFRGLAWWQKLGGQVTAAAIPAGFGVWVHRCTFPVLGAPALPDW